MSSQYVIEGFSAGSFFIFGGINLHFFPVDYHFFCDVFSLFAGFSVVLILQSRTVVKLLGIGLLAFSYILLSMFMRVKMSGMLHFSFLLLGFVLFAFPCIIDYPY